MSTLQYHFRAGVLIALECGVVALSQAAPAPTSVLAQTARTVSVALAAQARDAESETQKSLRAEFDTLAWLSKQTSDILLPLDKEHVLLQQYRRNLVNWRAAVQSQYSDALVTLAVRLGILVGILGTVVLLGEIWRRAVLRFTHEPRRRGQLLLIQRIVVWIALVAILGLVDGRMVAVIRYRVHLENSAEIDEHVGEAVLSVIEHETKAVA